MPAENSIAIHDTVENSGFSSSCPSRTARCRPNPSHIMNPKTEIVRIPKNQPKSSVTTA